MSYATDIVDIVIVKLYVNARYKKMSPYKMDNYGRSVGVDESNKIQ